jgi:DNA end-binding protein Ku
MRGKAMVALGRVVLSKRERVVMLQPWGKGLLGTTLRYPYEVRDEKVYFDDIGETQIPKDMLALAEHILETKAAKFDPSNFHDRYEAAIVAMLNEKKAGMPVSKQRQMPRIVAGTDLMAALRQSIEKAKEAAPKQAIKPASTTKPVELATTGAVSPKGKKAVKRNPDQREMLMPLAGGGPTKEAAEKQPQRPGVGRRPDSRPRLWDCLERSTERA